MKNFDAFVPIYQSLYYIINQDFTHIKPRLKQRQIAGMELFSCTNQNFGFIFAAGSNLLPFWSGSVWIYTEEGRDQAL